MCDEPVTGRIHDVQNHAGGIDSDFCVFSASRRLDGNVTILRVLGRDDVLTCRSCLYSTLRQHFDTPLDAAAKSRVVEALRTDPVAEETRASLSRGEPLKPDRRWVLAAHCYEQLGLQRYMPDPPEKKVFMGHLWHRAAWCVRESISANLHHLGYNPQSPGSALEQIYALEAAIAALNAPATKDTNPLLVALDRVAKARRTLLDVERYGPASASLVAAAARDQLADLAVLLQEAKANTPPDPPSQQGENALLRLELPALLCATARACHRAGLQQRCDRWLRKARQQASGNRPGNRDERGLALIDDISLLVRTEKLLLTAARDRYAQALDRGAISDAGEKRRYLFLKADLDRRLGQPADARQGFLEVARSSGDDRIKALAEELLRVMAKTK